MSRELDVGQSALLTDYCNVYALKHRNWWAVMGAIERGVSRVGHHQFMDTIWKAGKHRTQEEIRQVLHDYQSGRMGEIA